jgi:uncharacterized protein (TIGR03000 family)
MKFQPCWSSATLVASFLTLWTGADRASAQIVLGGGRVVIGGPVSFATSTGFGNYPGSDGFVPGYGYYPNGWRDSGVTVFPPWFYRPTAFAPPQPAAVATPEPALRLPDGAAFLAVRVPADAEVAFQGETTAQRGRLRLFVTPPLEAGRDLSYDLRVKWNRDGKQVEKSQTFRVRPGDRLLIDYLGEEESLPPPRKLRDG